MAKTKISEFSATPGNNTDIDGINIAEGCAPSGINDAIRELMSQLKDFQTGAAGDSFNGPVGTTTAAAGAFTTLSASSTVSGTGFSTYLASPPAIGGTAAAAGSFTTLSASSTVTLSGGTANGVLYLNGSKVATSGSALTFDGTTLTAVNNSTANSITLSRTSAVARNWSLGIDGDGGFRLTDQTGGILILSSLPSGVTFLASASELAFKYNSSSEGMRLTSTGLGIGTSSPSYKLDVNGNAQVGNATASTNRFLYINGVVNKAGAIGFQESGVNKWLIGNGAASENGNFEIYDAVNGNNLIFNHSGNLGLGVTPASWASVLPVLQANNASFTGYNNQAVLSANWYYNAGNKYIANGYSTQYSQASGAHTWYTAASGTAGNAISFSQVMTLDASGNLEIGGTFSQGRKLNVDSSVDGYTVSLLQTGAYNSGKLSGMVFAGYYDGSSITDMASIRGGKENTTSGNYGGMLAFYTRTNGGSDTERARIDSSGNLLVGTTGTLNTTQSGVYLGASSASYVGVGHANGTASGSNYEAYYYNSTYIGGITQNGTTAVAYNTSSDYRLKDNQQPLTGSGAFIDALQPKTWTWKESGDTGVGFIAHEVQEVSPSSVVGEKDAVDADGKPVIQAMEYGSAEFIANIIAELQSLRKRVAQLEKGN